MVMQTISENFAVSRFAAPLVSRLRKKAERMACSSLVYNWSLGGSIPEGFTVKPADPWQGDLERGRWLTQGSFALDGEHLDTRGDYWEPFEAGSAWYEHLHGFEWLRDLRSLGGDAGRIQAREMVQSWIRRYPRWHEDSWAPHMTGKRIAMWIALYDFYGASADEIFQAQFMDSLVRQARHLSRAINTSPSGLPALEACKGLLYAGVALPDFEQWIAQALNLTEDELDKQILSDGGHASRNPGQLAGALQILIDMRCALLAGRRGVPARLQHAIDKMSPALRFFRYGDKALALFNGAQEGNPEMLDTLLVHANARGKALKSLPHSGYEKITQGRTVLLADCGNAPHYDYDQRAHAAPLSFELSHGRDRVFVNCGTHPSSAEWRELLRGTGAHNTVCLNYRNAFEIRKDGHFGRKARVVSCDRQENAEACLLDLAHDGYAALNGVTHRRRLYMTEQGGRLSGEDSLTCSIGLEREIEVAVRFHLHPRVLVSLTQGGNEALLRLPGGTGWRFFHNNGTLALEDSVYSGESGKHKKTQQLVIYGVMESDFAQIKWSLQKETR